MSFEAYLSCFEDGEESYFPTSIVTHGLGLNITVNSYAGRLEFGLVACRDIAPKLDSIAAGLARALEQLLKKTK